jgi:predicted secreted hydrolase
MVSRRALMIAVGALASTRASAQVQYADVFPRQLIFPRDHGAHPEYRTEWWYMTGWLDSPREVSAAPIGFQITFFRTRTTIDPANPSAFAAKQLLIAHAAIADPALGTLLHDERLARTGFGAASVSTEDTDVLLDRWRLARSPHSGAYRGVVNARSFTLELDAQPTQPLLLQGEAGYSRKGPLPTQASYYYSQPHLAVRAVITRDGKRESRTGHGWLDHEWSSTLLADDAAGWDWIGMNFDDGSALTAFSIRSQQSNSPPLHAYASLRPRGGHAQTFATHDIRFSTLAEWTSPRTRATWPVAREVRIGERTFVTQPLMNDQELDSRSSAGAVYWEGASRLLENSKPIGRGYLEMTGYVAPFRP